MIYEMATGKQPDVLLSDAYDFKEVIDKSVKELLLFIFKKRLRKDKKAMLKVRIYNPSCYFLIFFFCFFLTDSKA